MLVQNRRSIKMPSIWNIFTGAAMCVYGKVFAQGSFKCNAQASYEINFSVQNNDFPLFVLAFLDNQTVIKVKITLLETKHGLTQPKKKFRINSIKKKFNLIPLITRNNLPAPSLRR